MNPNLHKKKGKIKEYFFDENLKDITAAWDTSYVIRVRKGFWVWISLELGEKHITVKGEWGGVDNYKAWARALGNAVKMLIKNGADLIPGDKIWFPNYDPVTITRREYDICPKDTGRPWSGEMYMELYFEIG